MRVGSPGFIAQRLREAREVRGVSALSLAEILGVTRQSVTAYEAGSATPRPELAERISAVLNFPLRFFFEPIVEETASPIFWRSRAAATKGARDRSQHRYGWLLHVIRYLTEFVQFPKLILPLSLTAKSPGDISEEIVNDAARSTRELFGLGNGAIENMTWLLEGHGIIVAYDDLGASTLDSFSQAQDERAFVIVNGAHGSSVRYRFDLAHELGHLVLHRNFDPSYFSHSILNQQIEKQAHQFAREFLMPPAVFARNFHSSSIEGLKVQKRQWGVSMQGILKHAAELRLISEDRETKLWRGLSMRGWRRREPFDDVIPRERPELLRSAFATTLASGVSASDILDALPYPGAEIERICGLDSGTLVPRSPTIDLPSVREIFPVDTSIQRRDRLSENSEVIPFGRPRRDR